MEKWDTLKVWLKDCAEHNISISPNVVLHYMENLEKEEKSFARQLANEGQFLFTGTPKFDQKAWEEMLEERGLQGLS